MSDKHVIGECSICGGPVEQYTVLHIVGPFPPPECRNCGAVMEHPHGRVIPMRPKREGGINTNYTSQSGTGRKRPHA